jgi:hypothetical protein
VIIDETKCVITNVIRAINMIGTYRYMDGFDA